MIICPARVTLPLTIMFVGPPGAPRPICRVLELLISKLLVPVITGLIASTLCAVVLWG